MKLNVTLQVTRAALLLSLSAQGAAAQRYSPAATQGPPGVPSESIADNQFSDHDPNNQLAAMLRSTSIQQQKNLQHALEIIARFDSASTCNRLAALNLINDCKSLEHTSENGADQIKSEYAAKLALCELVEATAEVPKECKVLLPSKHACVKKDFRSWFVQKVAPNDEPCYVDVSRVQLQRCLRNLHDYHPTAWTSYSNSRQNVVTMCEASRFEIEKEKALLVYKNLTEVVEHMASTLADSAQQMQSFANEQMAFVKDIRVTQEQALQAMQSGHEITLSTFDNIRTTFHSFTGMILQAGTLLSQDMNEAHNDVQELRNEMAEAAAEQRKEMQLAHQRGITGIELQHAAAVYSINTLGGGIATLNGRVHEGIDGFTERMKVANAEAETNIKHATTLNDLLENSNEAIQSLSTIGGILGNTKQLLVVVAGLLFLAGAWMIYRKFAGFLIAGSGLAILLYLFEIQKWLKYTQECGYTLLTMITDHKLKVLIPLCLLGFGLLSFALYSFVHSIYLFRYRNAVIPSVEVPSMLETLRSSTKLYKNKYNNNNKRSSTTPPDF